MKLFLMVGLLTLSLHAMADEIEDGFQALKQGDHNKAFELFQKACNLDNGFGCSLLGDFYAKGFGVKQDYSKAIEFYKKACDLKNAYGCENYAKLNSQRR